MLPVVDVAVVVTRFEAAKKPSSRLLSASIEASPAGAIWPFLVMYALYTRSANWTRRARRAARTARKAEDADASRGPKRCHCTRSRSLHRGQQHERAIERVERVAPAEEA